MEDSDEKSMGQGIAQLLKDLLIEILIGVLPSKTSGGCCDTPLLLSPFVFGLPPLQIECTFPLNTAASLYLLVIFLCFSSMVESN
jgi:hypothetical protein